MHVGNVINSFVSDQPKSIEILKNFLMFQNLKETFRTTISKTILKNFTKLKVFNIFDNRFNKI